MNQRRARAAARPRVATRQTVATAANELMDDIIREYGCRMVLTPLIIIALIVYAVNHNEPPDFTLTVEGMKVDELSVIPEKNGVQYNFAFSVIGGRTGIGSEKKKGLQFQLWGLKTKVLIEKENLQIETCEVYLSSMVLKDGGKIGWAVVRVDGIEEVDEKRMMHLKKLIDQNKSVPMTVVISGIDVQRKKTFTANCVNIPVVVVQHKSTTTSSSSCIVSWV